ncbi:MAG: carboxypeptidase-like regulatory domain-containing protein [Gemmatimonadota bacterium]|nr:carboxypeptidase-like regulatory domain-containing protein [Gemmatimonadota bacterium]
MTDTRTSPVAGGSTAVLLLLGGLYALFLLLPAPGLAQRQTGDIRGTVTDTQGEPLPGVRMTLTGNGPPKTRFTDAQGRFRFLGVDAGSYELTAQLDGFSTVKYPSVRVRERMGTMLEAALSPAAEDVTTVTTESPLLDERKINRSTISDMEIVDQIPTERDPWVLLEETRGVISDRINVGGNESGRQPGRVGDGSVRYSGYSVDVVVITDVASAGSSPTYYNFDMFEEFQVSTGGTDVDQATRGVTLNLVTRRGSNEWRTSGRYLSNDDALWGDYDSVDPPGSFAEGDALVDINLGEQGGTICLDRLWIFGADGNPIPDFDGLPSGGGMAFGFHSPFHFTARGEGFPIDLNGDGVDETRIVDVPPCSGGPGLTLIDFDWSLLEPTHLFGGGNGVFPIDLGQVLPATEKERIETTWDQEGPTEIFKLEDTHVFSTSFFLTGLSSYVGGGFQAVPPDPEPGRDQLVDIQPPRIVRRAAGFLWTQIDGFDPPPGQPSPVDVNADGRDDTVFIQLSDLEFFCPGLLGTFLEIDDEGEGGGRLIPDPAMSRLDCLSRESVYVNDRWRLNDKWSFDLEYRYDDLHSDPDPGPSDQLQGGGFGWMRGGQSGDGYGFGTGLGEQLVEDGIWIWSPYHRVDPNRIVFNDQGALPFDSSYTGLPDGRDGDEGGSFLLPEIRTPVLDRETGGFEWESFAPRIGITYALGEERRTLLRASFAQFAEQLGTGIGVLDPAPLFVDIVDPPPGSGVLAQGGFLVGGFGGPGPQGVESHPAAIGDGAPFPDFDGNGVSDTLILDLDHFETGVCPGFDGLIGGFVPGRDGRLTPRTPGPEDCRTYISVSSQSIRSGLLMDIHDGGWHVVLGGDDESRRNRIAEAEALDREYQGLEIIGRYRLGNYPLSDLNPGFVRGAPDAHGTQGGGVEVRIGMDERRALLEDRYAPGGGVALDDEPPLLYFVATGGSTGEVMELQVVHPPDGPVPLEGYLALEPVAATAADRARFERELAEIEGTHERETVAFYCLEFAAAAPPAGTVFRVAGRAAQQAFAPAARALEAARELHEAGLLNPDTDPGSYFHSIRQWAVWTLEKEFDADGFVDAFLEHTRENVERAGRQWSDEIADIVRTSAERRWRDVSRVLEEATR